jgi:hypothetical protein
MARIRYLKPDFFKDEDLCELPFKTRLLYAGLWCLADREGRLEDRPRRIKAEVFPYDKYMDINKMLDELTKPKKVSNQPFILRYSVEGRGYIQIVTFHQHQRPHPSEYKSNIPSPEGMLPPDNSPPSPAIRKTIYERDKYVCQYCGEDLNNEPHKICLDYINPITRGGTNNEDNIVTSCKKCFARKTNRFPEEAGMNRPVVTSNVSENDGINDGGSTGGQQSVSEAGQEGRGKRNKGRGKGEEGKREEKSRGSGNGQRHVDEEERKKAEKAKREIKKKYGFDLNKLIGKLNKERRAMGKTTTLVVPHAVIVSVCNAYVAQRERVANEFAWFLTVLEAESKNFYARESVQEAQAFKSQETFCIGEILKSMQESC